MSIRRRPLSQNLLTSAQAADEIGYVQSRTISHWCAEGLIKGAFQLPGRSGWRIPRKSWEAFIRERTPKRARELIEK